MCWIYGLLFLVVALFLGPLAMSWSKQIDMTSDWREASRESAHIAPDPAVVKETVIQVYAARAYNWRGRFAIHGWIAVKPKGATHYRVYQVIGWRRFQQQPVVAIEQDVPDRYWYGNKPVLLNDLRGEKAEQLIAKIDAAARHYPHQRDYRLWPGPNSNTFMAYIGRHVPELRMNLPVTGIGKDYLVGYHVFAPAISGTGYQFSLFGLLGVTLARVEGLQFNLLGLAFGVSWDRGLKLHWPGIGTLPR